jgi:hypothetical protein
MSKSNKLTNEELEKLKSLNNQSNKLKLDLAEAVMLEASFKTRQEGLKVDIYSATAELSDFQKELHAKYGDISINASTGEFNKK